MQTKEVVLKRLIEYYMGYMSKKDCPVGFPLHTVLIGYEARIMEMFDILEMEESELIEIIEGELTEETQRDIKVALKESENGELTDQEDLEMTLKLDFKKMKLIGPITKKTLLTYIKECEDDKHFQHVAHSTHNVPLTQVCFNCLSVRTTYKIPGGIIIKTRGKENE